MRSHDEADRRTRCLLLVLLLLYAAGRVLQLYAGKVPDLLIVVLQVLPPAIFAGVHGSRIYRVRGIFIFVALCLAVGSFFELLSLRKSFPFGHYEFTDLMGPKLLGLPILLALAYVGMGYLAWVVALSGLRLHDRSLSGRDLFLAPLVASFAMVAWDLSMDPVWAYIDRAWVWRDGGAYFGVPVSNFLGWFLTVYSFYQLFALYLKKRTTVSVQRGYWRVAILFYAVSAAGNVLMGIPASTPATVVDASGRHWMVSDIVAVCVLISIFLMMPFAAAAWAGVPEKDNDFNKDVMCR
jgi:putative membrane protein